MGNHDVGRAMAGAASAFWAAAGKKKVTKAMALKALDAAAKHFKGADAEFDDELIGKTDLSRLVAIAFDATPAEIKDRDQGTAEGLSWYDGPETRFRKRYDFC